MVPMQFVHSGEGLHEKLVFDQYFDDSVLQEKVVFVVSNVWT